MTPRKIRHCKCKSNVNPKKSLDLVKRLLNRNNLIHRDELFLRARQLFTSRSSNLDIKTIMGRKEVSVRCRGRTFHVVPPYTLGEVCEWTEQGPGCEAAGVGSSRLSSVPLQQWPLACCQSTSPLTDVSNSRDADVVDMCG